MMDRLLREGNPPAGQLASPKPQYKDVQTNNWEELKGEGGASYVKDKAVLAKLADLESELATIKANQLSGDQKVQLSGNIATLETIINAQSVPPGGNTGMIQVPTLGCKRMLFLVNCDKEWKFSTNTLVTNVLGGADYTYPDRWTSNQSPAISTNYPAEIVVGYRITNAANLNEALRWGILWHNVRVRIDNVSAETATVTVRVIRFWEV